MDTYQHIKTPSEARASRRKSKMIRQMFDAFLVAWFIGLCVYLTVNHLSGGACHVF